MDFPTESIKEINWDFPRSKTQFLTHKYHSYPARFIPQIPSTIYSLFLKSGTSRVFDPFVGCGTSLVEAILSKISAGGVDLNPLAVLISRVKTQALEMNKLKKYWLDLQKIFNPDSQISKDHQLTFRDFAFPKRRLSSRFTEENIYFFSKILDFIENNILETDFQNFFKVGLSSSVTTLIESKNWKKVNIWKTFKSKIDSMIKIMGKFNTRVNSFSNQMQNDIRIADSRDLFFIPEETIDCIVTSPPYVNALDYNRIHQYNMSILGYDYKEFAKSEIGAHGHHISNRWRLMTEYLADMWCSISEMVRISKLGGVICIVIGDSCLEYEKIKSHTHFEKIGELLGLTHHITLSRNIDTASKYTSKDIGNIFTENMIFYTKERGYEKESASLIYEFIETTMLDYLDHVKTSKGTCLRNKPNLSKERQELAVERVEEALSRIRGDYIFV